VVALLADGLTDRGHEVTLFAPPGSRTDARLVPPLGEVPPEELIGDPWYEAAHAVSAYEEMAAAIARVGDLDPHVMRARVKERFSAEGMVAGYERAVIWADRLG
jgi:hypothetical protein